VICDDVQYNVKKFFCISHKFCSSIFPEGLLVVISSHISLVHKQVILIVLFFLFTTTSWYDLPTQPFSAAGVTKKLVVSCQVVVIIITMTMFMVLSS